MAVGMIALTAVSMASSLYGGMQQKKSLNQQAELMEQQGDLKQQEAAAAAEAKKREVKKFAAKQKLAYIANGVTLEGSPLDVIDETLTLGQEEVDSIVKRGNAEKRFAYAEASINRNQGRAALIGGFGSAASTGLSALSTYGTAKGK